MRMRARVCQREREGGEDNYVISVRVSVYVLKAEIKFIMYACVCVGLYDRVIDMSTCLTKHLVAQ